MLDSWIKRHLVECRDLGKEPEFNKKRFWPEPDRETIERRTRELMIEHQDKQAE